MKYREKYTFDISLSFPLLERILYIEIVNIINNKCIFSDPDVKHWRYKIQINNWISNFFEKPIFDIPVEIKIDSNIVIYIYDWDSSSRVGQIEYD